MSRSSDVDRLLRQARKDGLQVEPHRGKWRVTNTETGAQVFIPPQGVGRGLHNLRSELRRLASPPPMAAAVQTDPPAEEEPVAMPVPKLLDIAASQGVKVTVHGGLLHVAGPVEAEPVARRVRDRGEEVLAYLNPLTKKEDDVAQVRDIARIDHPAPIKNVATDAQAVWQIIRDLARLQGDQEGTNAGVTGRIWRGALTRVMREARPDWPDDYRRDVSLFLERTGHMRCQSRNAKPDPIWWVRDSWDDGGLTVERVVPSPADVAKAAKKTPSVPAPPDGPVPSLDMPDPLAMLTAVAQRVRDAEKRAEEAEELLAEALAENEQLRAERDAYKAKVDEISNAFRVLAGGSQ